MNKKLKAGLVMGLAAAAAVMAVLAVSSVAAPEDEIPDYYIEGTVSPQQAEYVLKDCDGTSEFTPRLRRLRRRI